MTLWGSTALLELSAPTSPSLSSSTSSGENEEEWRVAIPLHLRYLPPNSNLSGLAEMQIPYPVLFWACTADEGSRFPINPFDRINLGYEGLFGVRTVFYHLTPALPPATPSVEMGFRGGLGSEGVAKGGERKLVNVLSMPVLDLDHSAYVEIGTGLAVALGFLWVLWCLLGVWARSGYGKGDGQATGNGSDKEREKKEI